MPLIRAQQPVFTNTRLTTKKFSLGQPCNEKLILVSHQHPLTITLEVNSETLRLLYVEILITLGLLAFIESLRSLDKSHLQQFFFKIELSILRRCRHKSTTSHTCIYALDGTGRPLVCGNGCRCFYFEKNCCKWDLSRDHNTSMNTNSPDVMSTSTYRSSSVLILNSNMVVSRVLVNTGCWGLINGICPISFGGVSQC